MQGTPLESKGKTNSNKMYIIQVVFGVALLTIGGCILAVYFHDKPKEIGDVIKSLLDRSLTFYSNFTFIAVGLLATHDISKVHTYGKMMLKGADDAKPNKK